MAKVLIFGTGGVGCIYGYICHKGGAFVTAVCRSNYEHVKEQGITIESQLWGTVSYKPATARTVAEAQVAQGPFDFILVCSKAFSGTAVLIKEAVSENTAIVLAQNGIGLEEVYQKLYPTNTIISGSVYLPTTQTKPGYCVHGPLERFEIGTFPANAPPEAKRRAEELSKLFTVGGANAPLFDDVQRRKWLKVAINGAWNPTTALTLCDDANFMRSGPEAESMIIKLMTEICDVAAAAGYPDLLSDNQFAEMLKEYRHRAATGGKEPSMLVDVKNNRPMEVEAILGNTLKIAKEHGVETKYLELMYVLANARNYQITSADKWLPLAM